MTSTEAPEGVAVLTDRAGVTGKTARKSASFALNATDVGFALPHPASSPAASASTSKAPFPLVTPGRLRQLAGRTPAAAQETGPGHPPPAFGRDLVEDDEAVPGPPPHRPPGPAPHRPRLC